MIVVKLVSILIYRHPNLHLAYKIYLSITKSLQLSDSNLWVVKMEMDIPFRMIKFIPFMKLESLWLICNHGLILYYPSIRPSMHVKGYFSIAVMVRYLKTFSMGWSIAFHHSK